MEAASENTVTYLFQVARGDNGWSCIGENIFDVLLEMEKENEKKEQVPF